jgi:hypothetical protein
MALPMQLRIKTTSERLRTNHIDLLEYTEKLSQENENLKNNMAKILRSSSMPVGAVSLQEEDGEPEEDSEKKALMDEISGLRTELEALTRQLLSSETEKKTLKAKAQIKSKPDQDERLTNLRSRLEEETRGKIEATELLHACQDELKTLSDENSALSEELESVQRQAAEALDSAHVSLSSKETEASELRSKLHIIAGEMDGISEYHTQCMDKVMESFLNEMGNKLAVEREGQRQQQIVIETLSDELSAARARVRTSISPHDLPEVSLAAVAGGVGGVKSTTKGTKGTKGGMLEDEQGETARPLLAAPPSAPPSPVPSDPPLGQLCPRCGVEAGETGAEVVPPAKSGGGGVDFPEYVKVVEENRLLKVQVSKLMFFCICFFAYVVIVSLFCCFAVLLCCCIVVFRTFTLMMVNIIIFGLFWFVFVFLFFFVVGPCHYPPPGKLQAAAAPAQLQRTPCSRC